MKLKKALLICILLPLYHYLFWGEQLGLNVLIFNFLLLAGMTYYYPIGLLFRRVQVSLLFTFVASVMVMLYGSLISKIAYFTSFLISLAFLHEPTLKSIWYVGAYAIASLIQNVRRWLTWPYDVFNEALEEMSTRFQVLKSFKRSFKLALLPLTIVFIFFLIFRVANPVFRSMTVELSNVLGNWLFMVLSNFSFARLFFFLLGLFWLTASLVRYEISFWSQQEAQRSLLIIRKRKKRWLSEARPATLALKDEYKMGLILMVMMNILLLVVNIIDIQWLWFGFDYSQIEDFTQVVHEGTYMLIWSIFLSMFILLRFFRGNLNFYPSNTFLKRLAYLWIFQNGVLVISVALRNYHYIYEMGWAYKRIGVFIFLLLTLFGLYTLYLKIKARKSLYYLMSRNAWAVYTMLICMSLVNWDFIIVQGNINHHLRTGRMPSGFTLSRSEDTLASIYAQRFQKDSDPQDELHWYHLHKEFVHKRIDRFIISYEQRAWPSWNYADYQAYKYLKAQTVLQNSQ